VFPLVNTGVEARLRVTVLILLPPYAGCSMPDVVMVDPETVVPPLIVTVLAAVLPRS
jgi:hypothetical protein